jgi:hypothetical protein
VDLGWCLFVVFLEIDNPFFEIVFFWKFAFETQRESSEGERSKRGTTEGTPSRLPFFLPCSS